MNICQILLRCYMALLPPISLPGTLRSLYPVLSIAVLLPLSNYLNFFSNLSLFSAFILSIMSSRLNIMFWLMDALVLLVSLCSSGYFLPLWFEYLDCNWGRWLLWVECLSIVWLVSIFLCSDVSSMVWWVARVLLADVIGEWLGGLIKCIRSILSFSNCIFICIFSSLSLTSFLS